MQEELRITVGALTDAGQVRDHNEDALGTHQPREREVLAQKGRLYRTRDEARPDLFFYIEAFYNRRRRHSSLDYLSPEAYEQLYRQQHELRLTPCPQN
jgi:transposase InsO family protein